MWYVMSYILSGKSLHNSTLWYVLWWNGESFSWKSAFAPILALCTSETELTSVVSCAQDVNFCRKLDTMGFFQTCLTPIYNRSLVLEHGQFKVRSKHVYLVLRRCVTTSTLVLFASFRPRPATNLRMSEPRLVLILRSSSRVLFFEVVFD